jgi:hypothetical protein
MAFSVSLLARVTLLSAAFSAVTFAVAAEPPQHASADDDQQAQSTTSDHERAELELKKQKKQRILGIIPNFNTSNVQNAAPLSSRQKFGLANGYPTYYSSAADVTVESDGLHVVVPFPEAGGAWGDPPEVRLKTTKAARYEAAISAARASSGSS